MKKRYTYSKLIKFTGHLIEGRGWTKEVATARFKKALAAFRKIDKAGLIVVDSYANHGKLMMRKRLVRTFLERKE